MARTYGTARLKDGTWRLDMEPHILIRFKRIFGKVDRFAHGVVGVRNTPEVCRDLEWFLDRYPLDVEASAATTLASSAAQHRDTILRLEQLIDPGYTPPTFALALPPRSYQAREAAVYLAQGHLLIADDVGLGKTAASICSLTDPRTLPAVVVTMTHLTPQWRREITKFAPDLTAHILTRATPYELPKFSGRGPDVVIMNYHKLVGWSETLARYAKSVIFDEIQELRRQESQKYDAAKALASSLPFRCGLSATPIFNFGGEIFNVLDVLKPGVLGDRTEFHREWCSQVGPHMKLREPRAFGTYAREHFLMIRHTRREVGRELPAVIRVPHTIGSDRARLDEVKDSAAELARIILREGPSERGEKLQASEQLSSVLRQATGLAKAAYVADFVRMLVDSGERVVLCGWHRSVYGVWLQKLADLQPVLYTGTETVAEKEAARIAFTKGNARVLILSLRSGAGLDGLQEASSVIVFGELDWSPGALEQCVGRLNRDGQSVPVVAYFLVAEDGADPVMAETLGLKREQIDGIRDPHRDDLIETLDVTDDRAKRLATHYLEQGRTR